MSCLSPHPHGGSQSYCEMEWFSCKLRNPVWFLSSFPSFPLNGHLDDSKSQQEQRGYGEWNHSWGRPTNPVSLLGVIPAVVKLAKPPGWAATERLTPSHAGTQADDVVIPGKLVPKRSITARNRAVQHKNPSTRFNWSSMIHSFEKKKKSILKLPR